MNIPLPYSLCGIGETNNYIENFHIISGNAYKRSDNDKTYTKSRKDFMTSSWRLKSPHDTLFNEGE